MGHMKQELKILSGRELKPILKVMQEQWGAKPDWDYGWLLSTKNKIYLVSKDIGKIDTNKLRVTAIGMYFGEWKNNQLRLSIEGSQLFGPLATKNVVQLSDAELSDWLKGIDVDKQGHWQGFVIIKHNTDFIGSGKAKDGKILNFVPKARRLLVQA